MVLKLKKEVRKQAKKLNKQAEKLFAEFGGGKKDSVEYDTNTVLLRMDRIEIELKALREAVNHDKQQQYMERMGRGNAKFNL